MEDVKEAKDIKEVKMELKALSIIAMVVCFLMGVLVGVVTTTKIKLGSPVSIEIFSGGGKVTVVERLSPRNLVVVKKGGREKIVFDLPLELGKGDIFIVDDGDDDTHENEKMVKDLLSSEGNVFIIRHGKIYKKFTSDENVKEVK